MAFCQDDAKTHIERLEHTLLYVDAESDRRGDVNIILTSPYGTVSQMLSTRKGDNSKEGVHFQFLTLNNWGENIVGGEKWKVEVCDRSSKGSNVKFNRFVCYLK